MIPMPETNYNLAWLVYRGAPKYIPKETTDVAYF